MTYKELQAARENGTVLIHRYAGVEVFTRALKVWCDPLLGLVAQIQPMGAGGTWGTGARNLFLQEEEWEDLRTATAEELLTSGVGL